MQKDQVPNVERSQSPPDQQQQAIIDLKTNQVRFADVNLDLDLDLSDGQDSFQANGSMQIVLNRKILEGDERQKALADK